jgi:hypothetical protein
VKPPRSRPRAALGALLICAMTLPLLSGCTWFNRVLHRGGKAGGCTERPFAGNADSRPPLKVVEGLSAPDTRSAVKIPELGPNARERPRTEPCLAQPPDFFAKPLQPAKGKSAAPVAPTAAPIAPTPAPIAPTPAAPATAPTTTPAAPTAPSAPSAPPAGAPAGPPATAPPALPGPVEAAPVPPG